MFASMKSQTSLKMGHVGSKTGSSLKKELFMPKRPHFSWDAHETWSACLL